MKKKRTKTERRRGEKCKKKLIYLFLSSVSLFDILTLSSTARAEACMVAFLSGDGRGKEKKKKRKKTEARKNGKRAP